MAKSRTLILAVLLVIAAFTFAACTQPGMAPTSVPEATVEKAEPTPIPPTDTPAPTEAPTAAATPPTQEMVAWAADGVIGEGEYDRSVSEAGVTFYWRTDGESLFGVLSAETTGWVAVGFDPLICSVSGRQGRALIHRMIPSVEAMTSWRLGAKSLAVQP